MTGARGGGLEVSWILRPADDENSVDEDECSTTDMIEDKVPEIFNSLLSWESPKLSTRCQNSFLEAQQVFGL